MSLVMLYATAGFALGAIISLVVVFLWARHQIARRDEHLTAARLTEASLSSEAEGLRARMSDLASRLEEANLTLETLRADNTAHREQISGLTATLDEQQKHNEQKLELLEQARERLNTEFRNLANEIFDAKQRTFREQNQTQLDGLLGPLKERIKDFEKRVEDTYTQESKERFSLIREVKSLQELNSRISKDAVNLTNALKGENKTQGTWGEVVLESVLEKSGLVRGREYEIQVSLKTQEGRRLQPDVVVHLPEGKDVIVDSKVSLVAYERACSAESEETRRQAMKAHVASLRQHMKSLSAKDYQQLYGLRTLDFVLLFVPVEAAFSAAVSEDADLFKDAFDFNIMVVSPSTLLATLRMIRNIWRFDQQNRNAQEIALRAGALYDKFVNFVGDLEDIGSRIDSVQTAYEKAHNKLVSGKGNLVSRAEGMRELGAKVSKTLPPNLVEMPTRDGTRKLLQ
ncbi:MAG: DNA recombination protein RmuC [Pseudomonadales bacterium]|nr:DNA recombination protein RmuC [Pseudomonadales bacterium]